MSWLKAIQQYALAHPDAKHVYLTESIREELRAEVGEAPIGDRVIREGRRIALVTIYDLCLYNRSRIHYGDISSTIVRWCARGK